MLLFLRFFGFDIQGGTEGVDMSDAEGRSRETAEGGLQKSWAMDLGGTLGGGQISTQNLVPQFLILDFSLVGGWAFVSFCWFLVSILLQALITAMKNILKMERAKLNFSPAGFNILSRIYCQ